MRAPKLLFDGQAMSLDLLIGNFYFARHSSIFDA